MPDNLPQPRIAPHQMDGAAGPGATLSSHTEQKAVREYLRVAFKYPWLIFGTAAAVTLLTLIYSLLSTPLYTAEVLLRIGTYSPTLPQAELEDIIRQQTREQDYLNTQVEILISYSLADRVLSDPALGEKLKQYLERKKDLLGVFSSALLHFSKREDVPQPSAGAYRHSIRELEDYHRILSISPKRKTSLVQVSVTTDDPEFSAQVANAHAQLFIDHVRSDRQKITVENLVFLKNQAQELGDRVALLERNLATYAEQNAIVSLNKDENITVKRMAELNELLTESTAKRIKSETIYREAMSGSGLTSAAYDDQSIQQLRVALKEVESEYAMLSEKFKPSYPRMVQLKARIDTLQANLGQQRDQVVKGLEATYRADLEAEKELHEQLEMQKSSAFELSRREVQYNIMKREYESTKDLHQAVLRQLKEAQVSAESSGTNIAVADHAVVPQKPSSPKPVRNTLSALIAGLLVGAGLALLLEALDNTIKTPDDIQQLLHLPTLGIVPVFASVHEPKGMVNGVTPALLPNGEGSDSLPTVEPQRMTNEDLVTLIAPRSIASEAFRSVRTGLILSSADRPPRVILVASGRKSEGKTTVVTNLAVALAQASMRTIVVDADLRRPAVQRTFNLESSGRGVVNLLTDQATLEEVVVPSAIPNLSYIPSGPIPPNPAELIGSRKMADLIQLLSERYDYVLIDTPPVLPVTDAVLLSRSADGVILVVRGQDTPKHIAQEAVNRLRQAGARILGVVLNDVDFGSGDYYFYYRDTYSYYYDEEERRAPRRRARGGT